MDDLSPEERDEFLQMLAKLMKDGVVGYEILKNDEGQPEKHYISNEIGDERISGFKPYEEYEY
jgi:hypothetical protein